MVMKSVAAVGVVCGVVLGLGAAAPVMAMAPVVAEGEVGVQNLADCAITAQGQNPGTPLSYLFVFDGRNAELKPVGGKASQAGSSGTAGGSGKYEFTMPIRKSDQLVTWFTDRPNRDAGHLAMNTFVGLWQEQGGGGFKADPPNVAISFDDKTLIATMTNPKIVNTKGGTGQALKATMTLIQGNQLGKLANEAKKLETHLKRAGDNSHQKTSVRGGVSVFVDGVVVGCTICSIRYQAPDCCTA